MTRIAVFALLTATALLVSGALLGVTNVPAAGAQQTAVTITLAEG
jgi:hypothetical protein